MKNIYQCKYCETRFTCGKPEIFKNHEKEVVAIKNNKPFEPIPVCDLYKFDVFGFQEELSKEVVR